MSTDNASPPANARGILPPWLSDRWGMVGIALVVYTLIFLAWTYFHWGGPENISLIGNLATFLPFLLATLMAWRVAAQPHLNLRIRRAWLLFGMGAFSVFIAEVIWTYLENVLQVEPFPSVADIFFLGLYPFLLGGLLMLPGAPQNQRERLIFWLDLIIVLTTASMFVGTFLIVPTAAVNNSDLLSQSLATAYPVGSLILLGGLAALLLRRPDSNTQAMLLLLLISLSFFLASDLAFGYTSLAGTYAVGGWVDVGWIIAQVFVVLAALRQMHPRAAPTAKHMSERVLNTLARVLPWAATALGYSLVIYAALLNFSSIAGELLAGAMLLTLLVIGRRIVAPGYTDLSLRTKLILTFVLVSGLSISLVALASYLTLRSNLESAVGVNLKAQAEVRSQALANLLSKQFDLMEGFLLNSAVQDKTIVANAHYPSDLAIVEAQLRQEDLTWKASADSDLFVYEVLKSEVAGRLHDFIENFPGHADALLTDKYGATIAATVRPTDYYQGNQEWWQAAYNDGQGAIYIGQPTFDSASQAMRLVIAAPVYARRKTEVLGIMRTTYHIQDVIELLAADRSEPTGEFDLLLPSGQLLLPTGLVSIESNTLARLQATVNSDSAPMSFDGTFQLVSQAPVTSPDPEHAIAFQNLNWTLVAHQELAMAFVPVNAAGQTALLTTLAVLILTAGCAFLIAQWLVAPISRLTAVATQIASGDLSVKARVESRDEIGTLASTFNTMLDALAHSQQELRQLFVEVERQKSVLELRVTQRTEELQQLNRRLKDELSERQRLVQSLGDSEARFRLLFAASPDAILLVDPSDPNGVWPIVDCNEVACTMNGYTREELIGQPIDILNVNPANPAEIPASLERIRRQGIVHREALHRHKDGHIFPIEYSTSLLTLGGRELVLGIDRDITERKQLEVDLREAKETAEAADRAKSEFLSRMSHELRTPMNAILGFAQLLTLSRKEPLTPGQQERVQQIVKGGTHLLELINEVLDISRIEAGRVQISPEPVRVIEILQEVLDLMVPLAANRNIQIQVNGIAESNPYVLADRQRFKQILLNLISNAVKYNREAGSVTITCTPTAQSGWQISIIDTGSGISPDNLGRLFIPFERLRTDQSNVEGTGLGLALAKRLTELMQGQIGVKSVEGQGSTFWIELPAAVSQLVRLQRTGGTGPMPPLPATARTLLYIEDNLSNFELIRQVLADYSQLELLWASEAEAGLDLARQRHPHLILLDLHLHGLDGAEVLRQLQQNPVTSAIPVVVISADATPGQIERLMSLGAKSYLTKPLNVKRFVQLVEEILGEEAV